MALAPPTFAHHIAWLAVALATTLGCSRSQAAQGGQPSATTSAARGAVPVVSATPAPAAPKAFGVECVEDSECQGGVCFHKRLKTAESSPERRGANDPVEHDGYCSIRCDDDSQCPVPPTKGRCGARGMCKRPE
jgi:hypothetical protein